MDEVVGIMRVNVEKVLERDSKLTELDQRADALQYGASKFEQQAGKLKRKQWWANMKMMIIMGVIGFVLLMIIIGEYKGVHGTRSSGAERKNRGRRGTTGKVRALTSPRVNSRSTGVITCAQKLISRRFLLFILCTYIVT